MLKILFKYKKIINYCLISLIVACSTSCVETIVISSGIGAGLAYREKTVDDTRSDIKISTKIGFKFVANGLKNIGNSVDITVNEGRVMLTGIVRDPAKAKLAQDLCWQVKGVNEVIDEIKIDETGKLKIKDFSSSLFDYLLTAEIETKFALAKDLRTLNYQITTVDNDVYLLGVALNDKEMKRAIAIASKVRGVSKVINHVILADDSRRTK
jgi:osmotically-inducible protein OsmY